MPHLAATITQEIRRGDYWEGKLHNIRLGATRIDGVAIAPGETFSFWRLIGRPSAAAGFALGRSIRGDGVGGDIGGGLCQLSGIVYEAGLRAGLAIVERFAHSRDLYAEADRFTPLGLDATVVWPYKDLRLRNVHGFPVMLRVALGENGLTASIRAAQPLAPAEVAIDRVDEPARRRVTVTRTAPGGAHTVVSEDIYLIWGPAVPPAGLPAEALAKAGGQG